MQSDLPNLLIRELTPADVAEYFPMRMRALREHPSAFSSDYEDQAHLSLETYASQYMPVPNPENFLLGAWLDGVLCGAAGFTRAAGIKTRHRATLTRMYVAPEVRRRGVGTALLQEILARARRLPGLEQIVLGVMTDNREAIRLYKKAGFVPTALTPRYLKIKGQYYDLQEMLLEYI